MPHQIDPELHETLGLDTSAEERTRIEARKRIEKRQGLQADVGSYVIINAFLLAVWVMAGRGYFWPAWVMAAWGVGIVFHIWDYLRRPITEADVDAEVREMQSRS